MDANAAVLTHMWIQQAQLYIRSLAKMKKQPWERLYPRASANAIDLLEKLLTFDPAARITVEEALAHPYLEAYHDENDEVSVASSMVVLSTSHGNWIHLIRSQCMKNSLISLSSLWNPLMKWNVSWVFAGLLRSRSNSGYVHVSGMIAQEVMEYKAQKLALQQNQTSLPKPQQPCVFEHNRNCNQTKYPLVTLFTLLVGWLVPRGLRWVMWQKMLMSMLDKRWTWMTSWDSEKLLNSYASFKQI